MNEPFELPDPDYLRDLSDRLFHTPGADQYDCDRLRDIAAYLEQPQFGIELVPPE